LDSYGIFKRGKDVLSYLCCFSSRPQKCRLHWRLPTSQNDWPSLRQTIPKEYAEYFPEYAKYFGVPLLLNKGICGMVFSGKLWHIEYTEWRFSQGFIQSPTDPSYFVKRFKHGQWLRLIFFVDDMLYCGSNDQIEQDFQASVEKRFHITFLGNASWFLQMRIHNHKDGSITLDQHRYVLNMLKQYDSGNILPARKTPLPTDFVFTKTNHPTTASEIAKLPSKYNNIDFRSAICTLLYLAYNTRADILFAVSNLSKACVCPGSQDYEAVLWLLGYLKTQPSLA
jgi:hypothetical protein